MQSLNCEGSVASTGLKEIKGLNTLVLKNNAFENLGSSLHYCSGLSKLSMAHNQLSDLGDNLKVGTVSLQTRNLARPTQQSCALPALLD